MRSIFFSLAVLCISMLFRRFTSMFHNLLMKFLSKDAHEIHKNWAIANFNDSTVFYHMYLCWWCIWYGILIDCIPYQNLFSLNHSLRDIIFEEFFLSKFYNPYPDNFLGLWQLSSWVSLEHFDHWTIQTLTCCNIRISNWTLYQKKKV